MKQKEGNIVVFDIGSERLKVLLGSCNETASPKKPFFELQGVTQKTRGISRKGTIHAKESFMKSVEAACSALKTFTGFDTEEVHVLYTHPQVRYFIKTMGMHTIKNPNGIDITREWLEKQKGSIRRRIAKVHRQETCTSLHILSILADGETITHDPYEYTATQSLSITFSYTVTPTIFIETLRESLESVADVKTIQPTAIANTFFLSENQKEQGAIVCDIGANTTTITICRDGIITGILTAPFGGNTITNEIALIKKMSLEDAETLKCALHDKEQDIKKKELQSLEKKIADHLKKHVVSRVKELNALKDFPGGIILIGGGARYPGLDIIMEKVCKIYTTYAQIPSHIQNQRHTQQSLWQSAYGFSHTLAVQRVTTERHLRDSDHSLWQTITKGLDKLARAFR